MAPPNSKRGKTAGRAASPDTPVTLRLPPDLVRVLDAWISSQRVPKPDRAQAIRFALREWLMTRELARHLGQGDE